MRGILFRAKSLESGEWAYGYYYKHEPPLCCGCKDKSTAGQPKHYILQTAFADWGMPRGVNFIEVDPNTLGQWTGLYTGLMNKSKPIKIFEGDKMLQNNETGVVRYEGNYCKFAVILDRNDDFFQPIDDFHGVITGNVYDQK